MGCDVHPLIVVCAGAAPWRGLGARGTGTLLQVVGALVRVDHRGGVARLGHHLVLGIRKWLVDYLKTGCNKCG